MSSYWDGPGVATVRIKMIYWRRQIQEGRTDEKALERFSRYQCEWEAIKEERKAARKAEADRRRAAAHAAAAHDSKKGWEPNATVLFP